MVRFAGELRRGGGEEAQVANRTGDLDLAGEGERFAGIARFGAGEIVDPGLERIGQPMHPARAFRCRERGPGGERGARRFNGIGDVPGLAIGAERIALARSRLVHVQPGAGSGGAGAVANEMGQLEHGASLTGGLSQGQLADSERLRNWRREWDSNPR